MKLSKDLVPIIKRVDIDDIATEFLEKYCKEALERPMAVPIEEIAELKMGLEIDYVNIDKDYSTLGIMIFSDGIVKLYDKENKKYIFRNYKKKSLLVEADLSEDNNRGRERFTITHEVVHWDMHQLRFMALACNNAGVAKVCRCPKDRVLSPKTPNEWLEWQADNITAAILMPRKVFVYEARRRINYYLECGGLRDDVIESTVKDLAEVFQVSKQAARIRFGALKIIQYV